MFSRKLAIACFLFAAACGAAIACGPDFPWQLLNDRQATMHDLPDNDFAFEVAHLVPVPDDAPKLSTDKIDDNSVWSESEGEFTDDRKTIETRRANAYRMAAEAQELTPDQRSAVNAMRMAAGDAEAKTAGANLPADVKLYTLGAREFKAKAYEAAISDFQAAIASAPNPTLHTIWTIYMLGRAEAAKGDDAAAHSSFAILRKLVAAGAPDPLNVAISSYGEEGRLAIERADAAKRAQAPGWQAARADALKQAVQFYALQAAIDHGVESLLVVADEILSDPADLEATINDDTTRRLIIAYLSGPREGYYRTIGTFDRSLFQPVDRASDDLTSFLAAIEKAHIASVDNTDRIAAIAYRRGKYDTATRFAALSQTPLSEWVQAKLALRAGKRDEAAALYAKAVAGLAADPTALDPDLSPRLRGERAVLTLSHQDYLVALDQLYPDATTYWGDIVYLSERVLTVDELKSFVDAHAASVKDNATDKVSYDGTPENPALSLRELFAKRLMREGRAQEALPYFSNKNKPAAEGYAQAVATEKSSSGIDRARALHDMAQKERTDGMELLGYEASPDFAAYDGTFDFGLGQTSVYGYLAQDKEKPLPSDSDAFTSAAEKQRFNSSKAKPDLRFHYRYVAAEHEAEAAKLVPQRSQAYAALLCAATQDVQSRNADIARSYYRQYVKYGAHVPWAIDFGANCPAPDFDEARRFHRQQFVKHLRNLRLSLPALAGGGVLGVGLVALFMRKRRRKA